MNEVYIDDLAKTLTKRGDPYGRIEAELGPAVKEYRKKWQLTSKGELQLDYPLHLNFELNYGCNLRCEFCIFSIGAKGIPYSAKPGDKIDFETYKQIIDQGVSKGLCSISLNGFNEPLLQKDVVRYIEYAKKAGVLDISLHTNGLPLNEKLSRELINSGITIIMFSIDAITKETYEKIRLGGNFEKMMHNVLKFIEIKRSLNKNLPLVKVSFVKNRINHSELNDFISFWDDKVDYFTIQSFCNPFVENSKFTELDQEYRLSDTPFSSCAEPFQRLLITSDGNVFPCCSSYGLDLCVGNIHQDTIFNIWNNQKMHEIRSKVNLSTRDQLNTCRKCRAAFSGGTKEGQNNE